MNIFMYRLYGHVPQYEYVMFIIKYNTEISKELKVKIFYSLMANDFLPSLDINNI